MENLHVVINVKDFKNMVVHAESLKTNVTALYSQPSKPLQFSYSAEGMHCEFTLMTIGEAQAADTTTMVSRPAARAPSTRQTSESRTGAATARHSSEMPPPQAPASRLPAQQPRLGRRVPANGNPPNQSQESQSLFMPEDDDRQWEPLDEREREQDILGWDASGDHVGILITSRSWLTHSGCTFACQLSRQRNCHSAVS